MASLPQVDASNATDKSRLGTEDAKDGPAGGGKLSLGGKIGGASQGLGKLASLMKKGPSPAGKTGDAGKGAPGAGNPGGAAPNGGGSGGLMGMLFLKKKLNKWRTGKLKTWNLNESTQGSVKSVVENTYRLEPSKGNRFLPVKVKECIEQVLQRLLRQDTKYNAKTFSMLSRIIADEIKEKVKGLGFSRYKLVVHVMLGENRGQGLQAASRCVWDLDTDNSASLTFRSPHVAGVINVFGTYYE